MKIFSITCNQIYFIHSWRKLNFTNSTSKILTKYYTPCGEGSWIIISAADKVWLSNVASKQYNNCQWRIPQECKSRFDSGWNERWKFPMQLLILCAIFSLFHINAWASCRNKIIFAIKKVNFSEKLIKIVIFYWTEKL